MFSRKALLGIAGLLLAAAAPSAALADGFSFGFSYGGGCYTPAYYDCGPRVVVRDYYPRYYYAPVARPVVVYDDCYYPAPRVYRTARYYHAGYAPRYYGRGVRASVYVR